MADWNFFADIKEKTTTTMPRPWISEMRGGGFLSTQTQPEDFNSMVASYKSWVYICASKNASSVAQCTLRLYLAKTRGGKTRGWKTKNIDYKTGKYFEQHSGVYPYIRKAVQVEEVVEHPFLDLMKNINPYMNEFDWKELTDLYQELTGNSYSYIINNGLEMPAELWVIPSQFMNIIKSRKKFILGYAYKRGQEEMYFDPSEIIHFKFPSPFDPVYGMGSIAGVANAIDVNQGMRDHEIALLDNNARPDFFLTSTNMIDTAEAERILSKWHERYGGKHSAGKPALLEGGIDVKQISFSPKELSYLQGRKAVLTEIAAALGVPLSKLLTEDVNKANAEAGDYQYAKDTILPRLKRMEQKLNEQLLPRYDEKLFCAFVNPVPEDRAERIKEREINLRTGYSSINLERDKDREPHVAWGDVPILQMQMVPLGSPPAKQEQLAESISGGILDLINKKKKQATPEIVEEEPEKVEDTLLMQREPWKAEYQEKFAKRSDNYTYRFRDGLKALFAKQELEVLKKMEKSIKQADEINITDFLFGQEEWQKEFIKEGKTYIGGSLVDSANQTMDLLTAISFNLENPMVNEFFQKHLFKFSFDVNKETLNQLRSQLLEGVHLGEDIRQLRGRVKSVFGFAKNHRAERIARSEVIRASNAGSEMAMMQSGVVEGKEWLTHYDARTCGFCDEMNGKTMKLGEHFYNRGDSMDIAIGEITRTLRFDYDYVTYPPLHPSCRCTLIPVLEEFSFMPAADIKEAEKWAKRHILSSKGKIDYGTLSLESINSVNKELGKLVSEYGYKLDFVGSRAGLRRWAEKFGRHFAYEDDTIAKTIRFWDVGTDKHFTGIGMNTLFYNDINELKKIMGSMKNQGWFLSEDIGHLMRHEYGHILHFNEQIKELTVCNSYNKFKGKKLIKKLLGGYADADDLEEFWAELFALYEDGALSKELASLVESAIGG